LGVSIWHAVFELLEPGGRLHAGRVIEILHRDWHPVQRASPPSASDRRLGFPCLVSCIVGHDGDERVQDGIQRRDAFQARVDDVDG